MNPSGLKGALERFAQFFIAPLIKPDALEREVNAVDNEFSGWSLVLVAEYLQNAHAWIWRCSHAMRLWLNRFLLLGLI